MTLRVAQVNCVIDEHDRELGALIEAWPTLSQVAEAAAAGGAEVHVLQSSRKRRQVLRAGSVTYRLVPETRPRAGWGPGIMPWRLASEVRAIAPDAVHFHGLDFPLHLRAICAGPAPVLVQDHATTPASSGRLGRRWATSACAAGAFTSRKQAEPLVRAGQLPPGLPIASIPESTSRFTPGDRATARAATGVFGDPALLWVGHLSANKDPLTILRAVRIALEQCPQLHLWCLFAGTELLAECQALSGDPVLSAHVHFIGRVPHDRVEQFCRACDLFVLGSHREGSGYALIEAMACGLVPVVSDIPSFRELTGQGAVGTLAPVGKSEAFAAGIVKHASGGTDARKRVIRHFEQHLSPAALGRKLVEAYRMLAAGGSA